MDAMQNLRALDAVAQELFSDGNRPVEYYLIEAQTYISRGDYDVGIFALCDALKQIPKTDRRWVHIMRAIRFTKRAGK